LIGKPVSTVLAPIIGDELIRNGWPKV